ncbi:nitrogen fixation protein FixF [Oricola thermophila]|uniref:Nitrogen fixation protein FixF n=1 Tax=Oricola thermophila TaxID=2742145 RepID=A0A6N1VD67_9HYPH|nr:nitrogen fixation protein FixF [Oricola thermophila]QKV18814.1 nitrogen fixation protein FixF [Oricola thermophila]
MTMRFAAIPTGNTRPLIDALGPACDAVEAASGSMSGDIAPDLAARLDAIAERNVTRRRIRFPRLFANPLVAGAYRAIYRRRARRIYGAFHRALAADTSRTVLVFNGYLAPNALLALAAEQLSMKRLFLENGFYPGTMQADPEGINALSTLPRAAAFYDGLPEDVPGDGWPEDFEVRKSKLKDGTAAADELPNNYVFVPFQVPSDMQILALSPWIDSMVKLHGEIAALADAFPERRFVIKEHPSFPLSIQQVVPRHSRIMFANGGNTRRLIEGAEAVITVNSTVGLEALTLGRKVITLGEAHYNIDGLVLHAGSRAELHEAFARLDAWQPDEDRRRRFIRFVFNRFLLPFGRTAPGDKALAILTERATGRDAYSRALAEFTGTADA